MATTGLPTYPGKGNRQELDRRWLALLHQHGLARWLGGEPAAPAELGRAVAEFNRGEYWQCHETLEEIWLPERYPLRLFYHGLIKAAVSLLHLERRNRHGATVKLEDAVYALAPFLPRLMGIDVARLRSDLQERLTSLHGSDPTDWETLHRLPRCACTDRMGKGLIEP